MYKILLFAPKSDCPLQWDKKLETFGAVEQTYSLQQLREAVKVKWVETPAKKWAKAVGV
jgi:hypothetical protein